MRGVKDPISARIATLPPLREAIATAGFSAKKSLGQNFLLDINLTRRIARSAGPLDGGTTIEIGPGPGGLTRALLIEGATDLIAIERDARAQIAAHDLIGDLDTQAFGVGGAGSHGDQAGGCGTAASSSRVYSAVGASSTCWAVPSSTIRPARTTMTRVGLAGNGGGEPVVV